MIESNNKLPLDIYYIVENLNIDQIKSLYNLLNNRLNVLNRNIKNQFKVGEYVRFTTKSEQIVSGYIIKINPKTIRVKANNGVTWRVSPNLLVKVNEPIKQSA